MTHILLRVISLFNEWREVVELRSLCFTTSLQLGPGHKISGSISGSNLGKLKFGKKTSQDKMSTFFKTIKP